MTDQPTFREGEFVDVHIRGAEVVAHGPDQLTMYLKGCDLDVFEVPLSDDDGGPLLAVTVTHAVPNVQPGQVWESVRDGCRFFVIVDLDRLRLISVDNIPHSPEYATAIYGQLQLVSQPPGPAPAEPAEIPTYAEAVRHISGDVFGPPHPGHPDAWPAFTVPDRSNSDSDAPLQPVDEETTAALPTAREPEGAVTT